MSVQSAIPIVLALALAACAPVEDIGPGSVENGIIPAASYAALQVPERAFASADQVVAYYLEPLGRSHTSQREEGAAAGGTGERLLLFAVDGLEDDAVLAQQWRVVLSQTDAGLRVVRAGLRQQCRRSGSDQWTIVPCP